VASTRKIFVLEPHGHADVRKNDSAFRGAMRIAMLLNKESMLGRHRMFYLK
jgi:hypothetical protein